jgi:N-acetylglutamate synthase-like GNAT family acetyltransferase
MEQFVYTNEGKVLLREAMEEDVPKIAELYEGLPKNQYWKTEELAGLHYNLVERNNGTTYVAVLGEEVIGHAEVVLPKLKEDYTFLVKVQIKDDLRRRKFGTELVRYSMIMTKRKGYEAYAVWPDADKSKGLYKKLGLKEIKTNQEIKFEVKEEISQPSVEVIEEIDSVDELKELELVTGRSFIVDFIWDRAFEFAKKNVLNYKTPVIEKVKVDAGQGIIFFDNKHLFIFVPAGEENNSELITTLLKYGSWLAKEAEADKLLTYIDTDLWEEISLEIEDYWEIEINQARLEMKMRFDD